MIEKYCNGTIENPHPADQLVIKKINRNTGVATTYCKVCEAEEEVVFEEAKGLPACTVWCPECTEKGSRGQMIYMGVQQHKKQGYDSNQVYEMQCLDCYGVFIEEKTIKPIASQRFRRGVKVGLTLPEAS